MYDPCITFICIIRADSRLAPRQWETSLQSNAVSHWLGANLESALIMPNVERFRTHYVILLSCLIKYASSLEPDPCFHSINISTHHIYSVPLVVYGFIVNVIVSSRICKCIFCILKGPFLTNAVVTDRIIHIADYDNLILIVVSWISTITIFLCGAEWGLKKIVHILPLIFSNASQNKRFW